MVYSKHIKIPAQLEDALSNSHFWLVFCQECRSFRTTCKSLMQKHFAGNSSPTILVSQS